jgi:hypothetical protein
MRANLSAQDLPDVRNAIQALMADFQGRMEHGESVGDLFHEQAVLFTPRGELRGRDTIVGQLTSLAQARRQSGRVARHAVLDLQVTKIAEGRYEARSLLLAFAADTSVVTGGSMMIADQVDVVVSSGDGIFRFSERKVTPALEFLLTPKG